MLYDSIRNDTDNPIKDDEVLTVMEILSNSIEEASKSK